MGILANATAPMMGRIPFAAFLKNWRRDCSSSFLFFSIFMKMLVNTVAYAVTLTKTLLVRVQLAIYFSYIQVFVGCLKSRVLNNYRNFCCLVEFFCCEKACVLKFFGNFALC